MSDKKEKQVYDARLCHVTKRPDFDGYGFNLHAEKGRPGQYIGKVDEGSPAESAGLRQGDRIVEVNAVNIGTESHKQVVERIKSVPNETRLLVIDPKADINDAQQLAHIEEYKKSLQNNNNVEVAAEKEAKDKDQVDSTMKVRDEPKQHQKESQQTMEQNITNNNHNNSISTTSSDNHSAKMENGNGTATASIMTNSSTESSTEKPLNLHISGEFFLY